MENHLEDEIENGDDDSCHYCGEPLEDGLCSASCHDSEDDEGRDCECFEEDGDAPYIEDDDEELDDDEYF